MRHSIAASHLVKVPRLGVSGIQKVNHEIRTLQLVSTNEPWHVISNNVAFFRSVDSDEPVQSPFKLRNSK